MSIISPRRVGLAVVGSLTALSALGTASAANRPRASSVFDVYLDGDEADVAGSPADDDGEGSATFWFDRENERVCYDIEVWDVRAPTAALLHIAPRGETGPVVVPLRPPHDGDIYACSYVSRAQIRDIEAHPFDYYVTLYNRSYPEGALRGQLAYGDSRKAAAHGHREEDLRYAFSDEDWFFRYDSDSRRYSYDRGDTYYYREGNRTYSVDLTLYNVYNQHIYYDNDRNFYYVDDHDNYDDHDNNDDHDDNDDHDNNDDHGWDNDDGKHDGDKDHGDKGDKGDEGGDTDTDTDTAAPAPDVVPPQE